MKKEVIEMNFVDLGLSVKWANLNVGSKKVGDYGKYFAWEEVVDKKDVDWEEYWALNEEDLNVEVGGRLPSEEEIDELISKCSWEWLEMYGVKGFKVSSKVNKNWIFIPAGGCKSGDEVILSGVGGYYLSKTMGKGKLRGVVEMVFSKSYKGKYLAGSYKRLVRLVK